jgi:hypothetical protein
MNVRLRRIKRRMSNLLFNRTSRLLAGLVLFFALGAAVKASQNVIMSWDPSPDLTVASYNVYYGSASRSYTNVISAGPFTSTIISGLSVGTTYYFAVTAVDILGQESDYSNEVSYTPAAVLAKAKLTFTGGQAAISGAGVASHTYQIQASTDLNSWVVIGQQIAGTDGSFSFTDTNAANFPARFYRFVDTTP